MISIQNLTKAFGNVAVLQGVTCEIPSNQVVGFLGVNGAGKTTTMRILTTALRPDDGLVEINGVNVVEQPELVRSTIGYLPEKPPLYPQITIGQYLEYLGALRGVTNLPKSIGRALEQTGLVGKEKQQIHSLSKGYRQRLGLAQALLHNPKVLILDEPASGLDPSQMVEVRSVLHQMAEDRTVLLSTHLLSEAEKLCDYNVILHNGRVAASGSTQELGSALGGGYLRFECVRSLRGEEIKAIADLDYVTQVSSTGNSLRVYMNRSYIDRFQQWVDKQEISWVGMYWTVPTLEEIFLSIVGVEA